LSVVFLLTVSFSPSFGTEAGIGAFGGGQTITTGSGNLSTPGCAETNDCYTPSDLTATVGEKIIMTNTDSAAAHTFTSGTVDGFASSPDGTFDSEILFFQDSYEWTPSSTGEYPYYCMLHVWMVGSITVVPALNVPPKLAPTIIVQTDSPTYEIGDIVTVLGSVSEIIPGYEIRIVVSVPMGNIVAIHQFSVGSDKNFSFNLGTIASINSVGTYIITAVYGDVSEDTTSFKISEPVVQVPKPTEPELPDPIFIVQTDAKTYEIGDTVIVSGSISGNFLENKIGLRSINPNGQITDVMVAVDSDKKFSFQNISPNAMPGIYRVQVIDGINLVAETTFTFSELDVDEDKCGEGSQLVNGVCKIISENMLPEIVFWDDGEVKKGEMVTFDASNSYDPDGTIIKYEWWFGDGSTGRGATPSHTYNSAGSKVVTIGVTDNDGTYAEAEYDIQVLPSSKGGAPDLTLIIAVIVIAAVAGVAGLAISRSRKSPKPKTDTTAISETDGSKKERTCNVCGTTIPEGKNVCPNCGDTYS